MRFHFALLLLYPFFLAPALGQPSDSVPLFAAVPDANAMRQAFSREMAQANAGVREASGNLAEARRELAATTTAIDEAGDAIAAQYTEIGRLVANLGGRFPDEVAALNAAREAMVASPSRRSQGRIDTAEAALASAVAGTPEGQSLAQARARIPQLVSALEAARERQESAAELVEQHRLALTAFQNNREAVRERLTELFENWAPAHVVRVTVRGGGEAYHEEVWTDPDDSELLELLRLADYIESDLEQLLARRDERIEQFIWETQVAMEYADVRLGEYIDWVGGNNPPGNWATFESLLDSTTEIVGLGRSGGALVTGGSGTWQRILLEISDRGITIGRDVASGLPPALSVAIELVSQLHATANRETAWDVLRLPHNDAAVDGRHLENEAEWQRLESMNTAQLRTALERLHAQIGPEMLDDSYASRLSGVYQPRDLAVSMSHSIYRGTPPRLDIGSQELRHVNRGDWAFFEIGLDGTAKSVLKSTVEVALTRINRAAQEFVDDIAAAISRTAPARAAQRAAIRPWHRVVLTELALDYLQAQMVAADQRDIEFERVARWARYLEADLERLLALTMLQNEGRIRRFERRLLELTRETQEAIRVEIELERSSRSHGVRLERALPEQFEIEVEFSHAVTVQSARIGDLELETPDLTFGFSWSGQGQRDEIGEGSVTDGYVTLELTGYRSPDENDLIDGDSTSIASLNTATGAIDGYEQTAFRTGLRMEPPRWEAGYGIVLDTSGSMEGGRLASAQQALVDMFEFGLMNERTIASVTTFSGCSLSGSDYTNEFVVLRDHIRSQTAGGGTPLAYAIRTTARNLVLNADAERRYLIVMSDGEESCEGSVPRAMRYARDLLSGAEDF